MKSGQTRVDYIYNYIKALDVLRRVEVAENVQSDGSAWTNSVSEVDSLRSGKVQRTSKYG